MKLWSWPTLMQMSNTMKAVGQIEATALRASLMRLVVINCTSHSQVIKWKVTNMQNVLTVTMETGKNMQWTLYGHDLLYCKWSMHITAPRITLVFHGPVQLSGDAVVTAFNCGHLLDIWNGQQAIGWRHSGARRVVLASVECRLMLVAFSCRHGLLDSVLYTQIQYYTSIYFSFRYSDNFC